VEPTGQEGVSSLEIAEMVVLSLAYLAGAAYMVYDPETLGDLTGYLGRGNITCTSPPGMVRFAGCVLLALPVGGALWLLWWPVGIVGGLAAAIGLCRLAGRVWPL